MDDATDAEAPPPYRHQIAQRLTEERKALGLSQEDFAEKIGKSRRSVASWELGATMPDADTLAVADQIGIDVLYVLTNRRGSKLTERESLLVSVARSLSDRGMAATLATAEALSHGAEVYAKAAKQTFHGDVGQVVHGDQSLQGTLNIQSKPAKEDKKPKARKGKTP